MTPTQQEEAKRLEQLIHDRETSLNEKEKIGQQILETIRVKAERDEPVDAEIQQLKVLQEQYDSDLEAMQSEIAELNQKYNEAIDERTGGIAGVVRAIPYGEFLIPLIPLLFNRPRQAVGKGLKNAAKGKFFDLLMMIPRMYGLVHSSGKPEEIAAAAVKVAKKKNRPELAGRIETALKGTM